MRTYLVALVLITLLTGCGQDCEYEVDTGEIKAPYKFKTLHDDLVNFKSREEVKDFLGSYDKFTRKFLTANPDNPDSELIDRMYNLAKDPYMDTLYLDCQKYYRDNFTPMKTGLQNAFKHIKYYYPDFQAPDVYTVITGHGNDIFTAEGIVVIGLEYFLGNEGTYHLPMPPQLRRRGRGRSGMPNYMVQRYSKPYIVPHVVKLLSNRYNKPDNKHDHLLAEMINYGKSLYFMDRMLPCTHDSLIIGYSGKQLKDTKRHEHIVWSHYIENDLLYTNDKRKIQRYIGERPAVQEIGPKCPGRIGRWTGWQIVKKFMKEHSGVTVPQLMKMRNSEKILRQSGYKPKVQ